MIVVEVLQSPATQALTRGKSRDQWVEGPNVEQWTFEQVHVVDVFAVGEVKLVPQERVRQLVG